VVAKVAVQYSVLPEPRWLIKVWFSKSTFVVKIAILAKPENNVRFKKKTSFSF
jgi:hypothetical protein